MTKKCSLVVVGTVATIIVSNLGGIAHAVESKAGPAIAPVVFSDPSKDLTKPKPGGVRWFWPTHGRNLQRTKAGNIELCFLGDSLTQGWPGDLFKKFGKNAANFGCGGDGIQNLLLRLTDGELKGNIAKLDDGKTVRFLDMGPKFVDKDGEVLDGVLSDIVHLTHKGYEIWAETMNPLLTQMIKQ